MRIAHKTLFFCVISTLACTPPPPMKPIQQGADGATKNPVAKTDTAQPKREEDPPPQKPRKPIDLSPKRFKIVVKASFDNLPKGSQILAPAPRDRHHQKIIKSDHSGSQGAVYATKDGANLAFLSEPLKGTQAKYLGEFHLEGRTMMPGTLDGLAQATYAKFRYPREKTFADAFAKKHGAPGDKPFAAISQAFDAAVGLEEKDAWKVAMSFSKSLTDKNIPHRMVQGLWLQDKGAIPHVWVDVLVPRLGWAPFDPIAYRTAEGEDKPFRGRHPADRVRAIFGTTIDLDLDADQAPLSFTGKLSAPIAIHNGKVVGKRSMDVTVEKLP